MAKELELTVMYRGLQTAEHINPILDRFEAKHHIHVNLTIIPWITGHTDLVNMALYHHGADVSVVGSTWISDLIAMNALRPFSSSEINSFGGRNAFVSSAMDWGSTFGDGHTYAIPWFLDPNAIFYWRDRLEKANVDEHTAFSSVSLMEQTLDNLIAIGEHSPWCMPLHKHHHSLNNVSSWIWAAGGNILSPDHQRLTIDSPEARTGLKAYFNLQRYMAVEDLDEKDTAFDHNFTNAKAVASLGGAWLVSAEFGFPLESHKEIGASSLPGISYVGGEALVVWKHTRLDEAAIQLVEFLTSQEIIRDYYEFIQLPPARRDVLALPEITNDPIMHTLTDLANSGRGFPGISLWGLVEDKLESAFSSMWLDIVTNREIDLDEAINKNVLPVVDRLNLTLGQSVKR
jgi:multiple sugar transport system substrate-binding protein